MHYLIDGYNLLFYLFQESFALSLEKQRNLLIYLLKKEFSHLAITLVFDGKEPTVEESFIHPSFRIIYAPRHVSADQAILDLLLSDKNRKNFTVVTCDKRLYSFAKSSGAFHLSNKKFLALVKNKAQKHALLEKKGFQDTKANLERLEKIFEEKLQRDSF